MIVTIIGAAGFIGINLTQALAAAGHTVRCFDRPQALSSVHKKLLYSDMVSCHAGDFFSSFDLRSVLDGCDVCCHLVSTSVPATSNDDPRQDVQNNLVGTLQLLDVIREVGVRKVIFPSSGGAIYGISNAPYVNEQHPLVPTSSYGIVKLAVEKYLALYENLYGIHCTCLRIANPYGPFQRFESAQGVIGVFFGHVLKGLPLQIWGDGSAVRDYLFIDDLNKAFLAALNGKSSGNTFNIGSGKGYSINELVAYIRQVTGKKINVAYSPAHNSAIPRSVLDIGLAQKELGWAPSVNLEQGLKRTWEWIQKNYS